MLRLLAAIISTVSLVVVAANGQNDGGYLAPELAKPDHLLDQDYLTSTGETDLRPGVL
jgi:hypothetical protein